MLNAPALHPAIRDFEARVADPDFPCVGAKSAAAQRNPGYVLATDLRRADDDAAIVAQLQDFAAGAAADAVFVSRVLLFPATPRRDEPRAAIAARDFAHSGSRNPMLATHGSASEARQYSDRQLEDGWRCPFSAHAAGDGHAA